MSNFEICSFEEFVAEATPQSGSLQEAASTQELLIQQIEGYFARLKAALCRDLGLVQSEIPPAGPTTFLELTDTPASYSGQAAKVATVNAGETALEFTTPAAGGGLPDLDDDTEVSSGRQFNGNDTFFKLVNVGPLPNTTTKNVAHNISPTAPDTDFVLVQAYGAATDPATNYIPLIFSTTSFATNTVYFFLDPTNVSVVAGTNRSGFTLAWVVLEYYYV